MTTKLVNVDNIRLMNAFRQPAFPCNPLPFLYALIEETHAHGSAFIATDFGRSMFFVPMQLAYGQTFQLDCVEEYERLNKVIPRE